MEWKGLRVSITNQEGEVFAVHDLDHTASSQLHGVIENTEPYVDETDEDSVKNLLSDLTTAADNVRRKAVTDTNNLIVSED